MAATHTPNLNLSKPDRQDYVSVVTDINNNMDKIDEEAGMVDDGIAIVIDGNTVPRAISSGQYLLIKNHSTLATGGYHATANIVNGESVTSSNVAVDSDGIANALNGNLTMLSDHIGTKVVSTSITGLTAYKAGNVATILFNLSTGVRTSGIQLPDSLKPCTRVVFTGKANNGSADIWYQGFVIDENGLLTARSINNNNAIAVTWAYFSATYVTV